MTSRPALGFAQLSLLALTTLCAVVSCRPREGERCICAGDCAKGLVCAADGAKLERGQCVSSVSNDLESGVCVAGDIESDDEVITPPPKFDAGSWATSGQVPITTAGEASESDATTMPDDTSSSSGGDSTSSSTTAAETSSSSTTAGETSGESSSSGTDTSTGA